MSCAERESKTGLARSRRAKGTLKQAKTKTEAVREMTENHPQRQANLLLPPLPHAVAALCVPVRLVAGPRAHIAPLAGFFCLLPRTSM
jgi:hypothetical protein